MYLNFKNKFCFLIIFFISILILLVAYYIEFALNQKPCKLCIYQRLPYFIAIVVCMIGYFFETKNIFLYLAALTFFISFLLSGYHVGIENEIFKEYSGCTAGNLDLIKKEEILNNLMITLPSCKDINFKLFGFSLATLNLVISGIFVVFCLASLKNEKN